MYRLTFHIIFLLVCFNLLEAQFTVEPPEITRLTIDLETQEVHIYWVHYSTSVIDYYEICEWRVTGTGGSEAADPIAQTDELEFSYYNADINIKSLGYCVKAYTTSDDSPLSIIDSTIFLTVDYDSCSATATLEWNDYNAWRGEIANYSVCNYTAAGTIEVLETLSEGVNLTVLTDLAANNYYRFFIIAERNNLERHTSYSNLVDKNTFHSVYPAFIHADYGTVNESNNPVIKFSIDPNSELNSYTLLRSSPLPEGPYDSILTFETTNKVIEYTDQANASQNPYYYKLQAINYCDQIIDLSENAAGTILLSAQLDGTTLTLNWTNYFNWLGNVEAYTVERRYSDENDFTAITQAENQFSESFDDRIDQDIGIEVCYRITALEGSGNTISPIPASSRSNISCIRLEINIEFGFEAFVPGASDNNTFGPSRMDFIPDFFNFKIYNRWGNLVFHSTDPYNPGWDGSFKEGEYVPQGVYRYQLEYKDETGESKAIHGSVTVVRL